MILQALCEYYDRKKASSEEDLAPHGWEWKEIPFLIVLSEQGEFQAIEDTREGDGKKFRAKRFLVPQGEKRTVGIKANYLGITWSMPLVLIQEGEMMSTFATMNSNRELKMNSASGFWPVMYPLEHSKLFLTAIPLNKLNQSLNFLRFGMRLCSLMPSSLSKLEDIGIRQCAIQLEIFSRREDIPKAVKRRNRYAL